MGWFSPLDRREITLLLLCVVVYILAYNLETSLHLLGVDSVATSGAVFSRIGLGKTRAIDHDGRKPNGWRDKLELEIYGNWGWDQGHVAGNGDERTQKPGTGQHGAAWVSKAEARDLSWKPFGEVSVDQAIQRWRDDVPSTKVLKHTAGTHLIITSMIPRFTHLFERLHDSRQRLRFQWWRLPRLRQPQRHPSHCCYSFFYWLRLWSLVSPVKTTSCKSLWWFWWSVRMTLKIN